MRSNAKLVRANKLHSSFQAGIIRTMAPKSIVIQFTQQGQEFSAFTIIHHCFTLTSSNGCSKWEYWNTHTQRERIEVFHHFLAFQHPWVLHHSPANPLPRQLCITREMEKGGALRDRGERRITGFRKLLRKMNIGESNSNWRVNSPQGWFYLSVIKHGWLGKPLSKWRFQWENHPFLWWIFQQTMFDDTGG